MPTHPSNRRWSPPRQPPLPLAPTRTRRARRPSSLRKRSLRRTSVRAMPRKTRRRCWKGNRYYPPSSLGFVVYFEVSIRSLRLRGGVSFSPCNWAVRTVMQSRSTVRSERGWHVTCYVPLCFRCARYESTCDPRTSVHKPSRIGGMID